MVDPDLGALLVLARELEPRGISLIPSASIKQARSLLTKVTVQIEVLVLNCSVAGVCSFAKNMIRQSPGLDVIGIVSGNHQCASCREVLTLLALDPEVRDAVWIHQMVSVISRAVRKPQDPGTKKPTRAPTS